MMRATIAARRLSAAVFLFGFLVLGLAVPASAASVLSNIAISPLGQGARVTLTFAGGIPQGWRIDGNGSSDIVVRLPGAQQSTNLNQLSYPGRNNVTGVSIGNNGSEIRYRYSRCRTRDRKVRGIVRGNRSRNSAVESKR